MWQAIKTFYYIHINMSVVAWVIGGVILFYSLPVSVFLGLAAIAWGTVYWYNSGKYSR